MAEKFVQLLRLIQISDLHCAPRHARFDPQARDLLQRLFSQMAGGIPIVRDLVKGFSGHHSAAWTELRTSIVDHVTKDKTWPETHLIVTGDLSTWGDAVSIRMSLALADRIVRDAGLPPPVVMYGNHDVWPASPGTPAGFPLFALQNLDQHRTAMRAQFFPGANWPRHPLVTARTPLPSGGHLVVFDLNTIEHHRWINSFATGNVQPDRYWQAPPGPDQLAALAGICGPKDVGIVLTHHPVHDDGKWTQINTIFQPLMGFAAHQLTNAGSVATALGGTPQRAHVVLSGHTHETAPKVGDSTGAAPAPAHSPLSGNHVQLTAGTATQQQFGPGPKPQAWQSLRFYSNDTATRLRVERIVFTRTNNLPGFSPARTDPTDPRAVADVWELTI